MKKKESPKKSNFLKDTYKSLQDELGDGGFSKRLLQWKNDTVAFILSLKKIGDVAKNNYELGKKHYEKGNFSDAIMRFKFVTFLDSKHANSWYWLGASYLAVNKKQESIKALKKALEIKPDLEQARDMLKVASSVSKT